MERRKASCEVCKQVEKLSYTVTRFGIRESYLTKRTFSGICSYCPKCGRKVR